ncbi:MAG: MFS transporter [Pirellulales bacterium]
MPRRDFIIAPHQRRRALAWGHVNAGLWAIGNALTTGPLVFYLARDLGATGLSLGLLLALPNLAGVLRLAAPAAIYRAGTARRACLTISLASYLLILGLPAVVSSVPTIARSTAVTVMIALLFAHQLLEYVGTVALWSWWGDLVPLAVRGRYFARRQIVQLTVMIPTLLASGYFADHWRDAFRNEPDRLLLAYAVPTALGALFLLASLVPLALMPPTRKYPRPEHALAWSALRAPLIDRRYWRLLMFRSWFSLANGVSQTVQNVMYPKDVLGFGVAPLQWMRVTMQVGQMAVSPVAGRASDRLGNRPVLMLAQACVSASLVFYLLAGGPQMRWLLVGAWVLFAAYAAHNICLPNLVLNLSPEVERPGYIALNDALASLFHAAATIGGGWLFDGLRGPSFDGPLVYRACVILLLIGLAMRSFGVVLLAAIDEPGAWTWREILRAALGRSRKEIVHR